MSDKKNPPCPKCGHRMKKNGVHSGRQKWRCTPCGASQTSDPRPEGRPRIHPKKIETSEPDRVGRPTIYPGRNLTDAESYLRHKKKKAMLALKEKFGD